MATEEQLTRRRPEERNIFGGEFTPFRDIWQELAGDLGITTKRMRLNAADLAAQEASVAAELDDEVAATIAAAGNMVGSDIEAAQIRDLDSRRRRLAAMAQDHPDASIRETAMLKLAELSTSPIVQAMEASRGVAASAVLAREETAWARFQALGDDLRAESSTFLAQRENFSRIMASAQDPTPAGDIALVFNFMKPLDPTSTVMPSEQANARNAGAIDETIRGLYNRLVTGTGTLSDTVRADFLQRSQALFKGARELQLERNTRYLERGRAAGLTDAYLATLPVPLEAGDLAYPGMVSQDETADVADAPGGREELALEELGLVESGGQATGAEGAYGKFLLQPIVDSADYWLRVMGDIRRAQAGVELYTHPETGQLYENRDGKLVPIEQTEAQRRDNLARMRLEQPGVELTPDARRRGIEAGIISTEPEWRRRLRTLPERLGVTPRRPTNE